MLIAALAAAGTALATDAAGTPLWCSRSSSGGCRSCPHRARPPTASSRRSGAVLRSRPARTLLLLATVEGGILMGALTFLPAAVGATGSGTAGGVTAAYGLAVLVCAPIVGRLQHHVPAAALIAAGAACAVIGCALAAVTAAPVAAVIVCLLIGAARASMHSTLQTWATEVVPEAGLASVSLFACALFTGSALAAVAGGPHRQLLLPRSRVPGRDHLKYTD